MRSLGRRVSLDPVEGVSQWDDAPNTILRCRLDAGEPATVVLKWPNQPQGFLYSEWASLAFLAGIDGARDLVPRFYGGDRDLELLVVEDLGPADQRLGTLLDGDDAPRAREALLFHQRALGRLHGATAGHRETFHRIRAGLPDPGATRHRIFQILDALPELEDAACRLGVGPPAGLTVETIRAAETLRRAGPFDALVHGDATPANAFVTAAGVKLYDWETARYRHAFLDGAFARVRYLHSVLACRIPAGLRRDACNAYRHAVADYIPQAYDDAVFWPHYLAASLGWLAGICRFLPRAIEADALWGRTTVRQRIAEALVHFCELAHERHAYPAAAETAQKMHDALARQWAHGEMNMPPYRAFAQASDPSENG